MLPLTDECIHVSPGAALLPIAKHQIGLADNLAIGPCRVDPDEHRVVRRQFWNSMINQDRDDIYSRNQFLSELSKYPDSAPIVLWKTPVWREQLLFWWMADSLSELYQLASNRFWFVESIVEDRDDASLVYPLGAHNGDQLQIALQNAEHISPDLLKFSTELWRAFSGNDPIQFCELRNEKHPQLTDINQRTAPYRLGFPQTTTDGTLILSEWDQFLFAFLDSEKWVRPVDIIAESEPYSQPIDAYPDSFVPARLRCWSQYRPENPAIISEPREGVNRFTNIAYRLTDYGQRLLYGGMKDLSEAPCMDVGGVQAYCDPWVIQSKGDNWQIIHT